MEYGSLTYGILKSFHIVAMVAWMAGMLYLPRLFVYHAEAEHGSRESATFKTMERRLLKVIMNPAMAVTWIFGLVLASTGGFFGETWLNLKILMVIVLSALHGFLARMAKDFAADRNTRPAGFYRIINEVPAVILFVIVLLVVIKPF
jgi:putative membrane protein